MVINEDSKLIRIHSIFIAPILNNISRLNIVISLHTLLEFQTPHVLILPVLFNSSSVSLIPQKERRLLDLRDRQIVVFFRFLGFPLCPGRVVPAPLLGDDIATAEALDGQKKFFWLLADEVGVAVDGFDGLKGDTSSIGITRLRLLVGIGSADASEGERQEAWLSIRLSGWLSLSMSLKLMLLFSSDESRFIDSALRVKVFGMTSYVVFIVDITFTQRTTCLCRISCSIGFDRGHLARSGSAALSINYWITTRPCCNCTSTCSVSIRIPCLEPTPRPVHITRPVSTTARWDFRIGQSHLGCVLRLHQG